MMIHEAYTFAILLYMTNTVAMVTEQRAYCFYVKLQKKTGSVLYTMILLRIIRLYNYF